MSTQQQKDHKYKQTHTTYHQKLQKKNSRFRALFCFVVVFAVCIFYLSSDLQPETFEI